MRTAAVLGSNAPLPALLDRPIPARLLAPGLLLIAACWWATEWRTLQSLDGELANGAFVPTAALAGVSLLGRLVAAVLEAIFYAGWWRTWGRKLPFGWFFTWLLTLSAIDLVGQSVIGLTEEAGDARAWLAPIVGLRLWKPDLAIEEPALWAAFGGFGVLTALRVLLTAERQARALGTGVVRPLLFTSSAWLVTHVALWWGMDLVRGVSPLS